MTVKEGDHLNSCPYQLAKLSPLLSSKYYEKAISDKSTTTLLEAWDLMMGINDLAACIKSLKKAMDKKNGLPVRDEKELYFHHTIDL